MKKKLAHNHTNIHTHKHLEKKKITKSVNVENCCLFDVTKAALVFAMNTIKERP